MAYLSASTSALSPREMAHSAGISGFVIRQPSVVEYRVSLPRGYPVAAFGSTHGALVIDSTPPAMAIEASPTAIARDSPITASRPDPHSRFTVAAGTVVAS